MNNGFYEFSRGNQQATSSVFPYTGSAVITGSLTITGSLSNGEDTTASGSFSHAEGAGTQAIGNYSHAEGVNTVALGLASHAEGFNTIASGQYQHVQGQNNLSSEVQSAFIIGNGVDVSNRSNLVFAAGNTFQVTGSLGVSGSITGSLFGTSSFSVSSSFTLSSSFAVSASWANNATTASYALNGGVTQLLAGPNITLSPASGLGQVTVSATLSGSTIFNTATGSYGSFYDTTTQTNLVANIPRSMSLNETDISNGVSVSGSTNPFNTYIKTENAGIYNIQFSAQVDKTDGGTDEIVIWLRKNGIDLTDTATTITLNGNNDKQVAAWNWFVTSAANDYYQIIWISADTGMRLLAETISATHPGIPSVIVTANRVDQFLSNTGSFSGSFTGQFTGSLEGTASWATNSVSASYFSGNISLDQLSDVSASVPQDTDILMYNLASSVWENKNPFDYFDAKSIVYQKHINIPTWGQASPNNVQGVTFSIQGPVARSWADTNIVTRTQRLGMNGATTGTVGAQFRQTLQHFSRNGGFSVTSGFNMAENANDTAIRFLIGIRSSIGTYSNVEPDTLINLIGVCRLSTSNNLHLIHNDATGTATTIDLGSDFPANTVSIDKYVFVIETVPTGVYFRLERVGTSFVYERTITTDLPAADLGLVFGGYMVDTAGANTTTGFDWYGTYTRV